MSGSKSNRLQSSVHHSVIMGVDLVVAAYITIESKGKESLTWGKGKGCAGQPPSRDGLQPATPSREMQTAT